jgi:DNA-binding transcriptional LysR family regulator
MEFRPLRAFVEVVRQGGFSQSAPVFLLTTDTRATRRGVLRIDLPPLVDGDAFATAVAEYRLRHPSIDIRLFEAPRQQLEQKLNTGEADLAVMTLRSRLVVHHSDFESLAVAG